MTHFCCIQTFKTPSLTVNQQTKNVSHLLVISFSGSCNKKIYKSPIQPHVQNFKFWLTQCEGGHKIALSWEVVRFTTRHDVIRSKLLQKPVHTLAVIGHYFCSYFSSIFDPTSLHIPYPAFPPYVYFPYASSSMPSCSRTDKNMI